MGLRENGGVQGSGFRVQGEAVRGIGVGLGKRRGEMRRSGYDMLRGSILEGFRSSLALRMIISLLSGSALG